MSKQFTYQDVAEHNTKKDVYVVIHDKVYDTTSFVDEHPGGEEVVLDVAGQDATEAFEDVGHSDEARETLDKLYVGDLKRMPGDPTPGENKPSAKTDAAKYQDSSSVGVGVYAIIFIGGLVSYFTYNYLQAKKDGQ